MKLGKLQEIDIRKVWQHEQYDFSKWLASEENIQELGDALNLSLTDVETEKFVGNYRCDILCKDELTGKVVLIENQLESTNHDHLGKIITYASGLDASVVVWIVSSARQEHASAIEWFSTFIEYFIKLSPKFKTTSFAVANIRILGNNFNTFNEIIGLFNDFKLRSRIRIANLVGMNLNQEEGQVVIRVLV